MEEASTLQSRIDSKLRASLPTLTHLVLQDKSGGCGQALLVIVVATEFSDLKLLERQQKVNTILAEEIAQVHAFELKTWTPDLWEKKRAEYE
jgi:stress-induced morphogen